jgi:hypothetical protein
MIVLPTCFGFVKASVKISTPLLTFDAPAAIPVPTAGPYTVYATAHVAGGPFWIEWQNQSNPIITAGGLSTDKVHNVTGMTVTTGMVLYGFGTIHNPVAGNAYEITYLLKTVQGGTLIGSAYWYLSTLPGN